MVWSISLSVMSYVMPSGVLTPNIDVRHSAVTLSSWAADLLSVRSRYLLYTQCVVEQKTNVLLLWVYLS